LAILEHLGYHQPHLGFLIAVELSHHYDIAFDSMPVHDVYLMPLTPEEIRFSALRFGPGVTKLNMQRIYCNDDILRALSRSSASQTLRRLNLRNSSISDESRDVWSDFKALESLKLSYSSRITHETLRAVGRIPTLERVEATDLLIDELTVFQTLLEEGSLTRLSRLVCDASTASYRDLLPILQARSNRDQVSELLFSFIRLDVEQLHEILQLFPNLSHPPCSRMSMQLFASALPRLSLLRELCIQGPLSEIMILAPDDIEMISQTCPLLEKLEIMCSVVSSSTRFHTLLNLRKLDIGWLAQSWKEDGGTDNTLAAYGDFVRALCTLTQLEVLRLYPCGPWNFHHYEWLVASLVNAKELFVSDGAETNLPRRATLVNHPKLREATVDEICVPSFGYLPSLERISGWVQGEVELQAIKSIRTATLPKLKHLTLDVPTIAAENFDYESNVNDRVILDLLAAYSDIETRLAPRLLQFGLSGGPFSQHIRWIPFQNVYQLALDEVDLTSAMCERMLTTLKMLNTLSLASCRGIDSYSWIKHPRLMNLTLSDLKPPVDESAYVDPDATMIQLSPSTLPCLKELFIVAFKASVIAIWELPYLQVCRVSHGWGAPVSFSLESCSALLELRTSDTNFSRFTVDGIAHLALAHIRVKLVPNGVLRWPENLPELQPIPVDETEGKYEGEWKGFRLVLESPV
jgi:hypothetical protein